MNHTEEAIKSAKPSENFTGWNLDEHAERNGWAGVGLVTGVTKHRDSEAIERANFDSAYDQLTEAFSVGVVEVVRFGHWAVGWFEILTYNTGVNGLAEAVANIIKRLDEYPILDEDLWSQYEWDENHPEDDNRCWDEDECSCGLPKV